MNYKFKVINLLFNLSLIWGFINSNCASIKKFINSTPYEITVTDRLDDQDENNCGYITLKPNTTCDVNIDIIKAKNSEKSWLYIDQGQFEVSIKNKFCQNLRFLSLENDVSWHSGFYLVKFPIGLNNLFLNLCFIHYSDGVLNFIDKDIKDVVLEFYLEKDELKFKANPIEESTHPTIFQVKNNTDYEIVLVDLYSQESIILNPRETLNNLNFKIKMQPYNGERLNSNFQFYIQTYNQDSNLDPQICCKFKVYNHFYKIIQKTFSVESHIHIYKCLAGNKSLELYSKNRKFNIELKDL